MDRIVHGTLAGPAGPLEYILNEPTAAGSSRAAIVMHPHPLYRGTMHTRIVFHTAKTLAGMGLPTLRFNFRGVGQSAGQYDHGRGELDDLRAAIGFLRESFPLPLLLAGFSFGATLTAKFLAEEARPDIVQAVLLGLPVDSGPISSAWRWHGPKLMISGDHDQFARVESLETYFAALPGPKQRIWIPGGDHFLTGHMEAYRAALAGALAAG
ncbi:MAG: alpha/beta hydrolase [Terriglobales bacterium]